MDPFKHGKPEIMGARSKPTDGEILPETHTSVDYKWIGTRPDGKAA